MLVIAHRGASAELPENTLPAFERAIGEGYAAVEFLRASDGRGAYLLVPQPRREMPLDTDDG